MFCIPNLVAREAFSAARHFFPFWYWKRKRRLRAAVRNQDERNRQAFRSCAVIVISSTVLKTVAFEL